QEDIAQAVVSALEIHLGATRGPLVRPPTSDMTAYELFLKGRAMRRRFTPDDLTRAIGYFEQAIARDPNYAQALAWLSNAHRRRRSHCSKRRCAGAPSAPVCRVLWGGRRSGREVARARRPGEGAFPLHPS